MIDPLPIGYLGLSEAVERLATVGILKRPEKFNSGAKGPDPHQNDRAVQNWSKRELAINELRFALRTGAILALVRDPSSGQMFRLERADWDGAAFWRETILSGVVRASA